jgi:hypothetical protein
LKPSDPEDIPLYSFYMGLCDVLVIWAFGWDGEDEECREKFCGIPLIKQTFEDREVDARMTLRWILGKRVAMLRFGWNWLRIMSSGELWY